MDKKLKLIKDEKEKENVLKLVELALVPEQILYEPILFNKNNKEKKFKNEQNDMIFFTKSNNNLNDFKYVFKGNNDNIINLYDNNLNCINVDLKNNSLKERKIKNIQIKILNLIYISIACFRIVLSSDNYLYKITNSNNRIINKDNNLDKV